MGNYVSCTLSNPVIGQNAARVILPGGEVRRVDEATKVAEIMLETPNFFVVDSRSVRIGKRFSALNADEDLEMGKVYAMFPTKRVNAVVTAADMGAMFIAATAKKRRIKAAAPSNSGGQKRVLPAEEETVTAAAPMLNLDDVQDFSAPEFMHRLSMSRSKKPLLETIAE